MEWGSPGSSPHRWNQIKRLPLYPAIRSLTSYEEAVTTGTLDALAFLRGIDVLQGLGVADICHVHYEMFKAVHPWAGQVRTRGQLTTVAGYPAADPERIHRELELTLFQTRELLPEALFARDRQQIVGVLAFLHVRFERVHPFLDGNGRCGRAVLAVQFEKVFGILPRFTDQPGYRAALRASSARNLAPLINYLGTSLGLPEIQRPVRPRFQIRPRFLDGTSPDPTFEEDLVWSRNVR